MEEINKEECLEAAAVVMESKEIQDFLMHRLETRQRYENRKRILIFKIVHKEFVSEESRQSYIIEDIVGYDNLPFHKSIRGFKVRVNLQTKKWMFIGILLICSDGRSHTFPLKYID